MHLLRFNKEKQNAHASGMFGSISSVQYSPDGSKIVSGGIEDKTLKVWDAGVWTLTPPTLSPKLTAPLPAAASLELKAEQQSAHSARVTSVAFSPDGKTIVSGSYDKTLKVWDAGVSALTPSNP